MDSYEILWKKSAARDLGKIDRQHIPRLIHAIESPAKNPFPHQCRKLLGTESVHRIRVGEYRAIYMVDTKAKCIVVFHIRHRKEAYRKYP